MKVRITRSGIYGADGPIPVGTVLTVTSEPTHWGDRYEIITDNPTPASEPINTEPKPKPKPKPKTGKAKR